MPEAKITNKALVQRIVRAIEAGNNPVTAARANGVSSSTFYRWMQRGQEEEEGPYAEFFAALDQADARSEQTLVGRFAEATEGDWKATESFLSRRFSKTWGNKQSVQVDQRTEISGTVDVRQTLETPGMIEALTDFYEVQIARPQPMLPAGDSKDEL